MTTWTVKAIDSGRPAIQHSWEVMQMQKKTVATPIQKLEVLFTQQEVNEIMRKRLVRAKKQFKREIESKEVNN